MIENDTEAFRSIKELMEEACKKEEESNKVDNSEKEDYFEEINENDLYGNRWE